MASTEYITKSGAILALSRALLDETITPSDAAVTTAKLADNAVTTAKIADDAVGPAEILGALPSVAALPGTPTDGQIAYFDAAAGVVWQLRYRASTTDWEYIGGPPLAAEVATSESTTSATYAALATAGPSVTVPLAGDYDVEVEVTISGGSATDTVASHSYDIGGTGAVVNDAAVAYLIESGQGGAIRRTKRKTSLAAATALVSKYRTTGAVTTFFELRRLAVTPVRLDG